MKNFIKFLGMLVCAALSFVACQKEKLVDKNSSSEVTKIAIHAIADSYAETKTELIKEIKDGKDYYKTLWSGDEKIAMLEVANYSKITSVERAISDQGELKDGKMKFTASFKADKTGASSFDYYAVYPDKALGNSKPAAKEELSNITLTLDDKQTPTATSFGSDADILVALPNNGIAYDEREKNTLEFRFARLVAIGKMGIKNLKVDGEVLDDVINRIIITSGTNVRISGNTNFDLNNGKKKSNNYGNKSTITLDYSGLEEGAEIKTIDTGTDNFPCAYFTAWPFTMKAGETLDVKVETEHYTFTKTITFGKEFSFLEGKVNSFNVNFDGIEGEGKEAPALDLKHYDIYVICNGDNVLAANNTKNYQDSKKNSIEVENGILQIEEEDLTSAWKFAFNPKNYTYKISSIEGETKFIRASSPYNSSLNLVTDINNATGFTINKNGEDADATYNITTGADGRYNMGYRVDNNIPQFSMLDKNNESVSASNYTLRLLPAVIRPIIRVQKTLEVANTGINNVKIPVSYINIDATDVTIAVNYPGETTDNEWLAIEPNDDKTKITCTVAKNESASPRIAYIVISGTSAKTKEIKVTQYGSFIYYASLTASELTGSYTPNANGEVEYVQPNGTKWIIKGTINSGSNIALGGTNYIKLPEFGREIRNVIVTLNKSVIGVSLKVADVTQETVKDKLIYSFDIFSKNVKTATLTSTGYVTIKSILVETREPLETPDKDSFTVNGKTLSWTEVANADSYDVTVGTTTANVTTNSYEFKGEDEWYDVTIVAKADEHSKDYCDSPVSEKANLQFGTPKLQAPVLKEGIVTSTSINVTWDAVANAEKYTCKIFNSTDTKFEAPLQTISTKVGELAIIFGNLIPSTDYVVTVCANATAKYGESATSDIPVTTLAKELRGDGSVDNPYKVDDVIYLNSQEISLAGKYVTGTVSAVSILSNGKLSYTIKDNLNDSEEIGLAVTGKDLGDKNFTRKDQLMRGNLVKIYYKTDIDNYLYSINGMLYVLTDIAVNEKESKIKFEWEETFVEPVVTATYRGKAKENVSGCKFTIGDQQITAGYALQNLNDGEKTVTVSYTDEHSAVTKTTQYKITVLPDGKVTYTHVFTDATVSESLLTGNYGKGTNVSGNITTDINRFYFVKAKSVLRGKSGTNSYPSITTQNSIPEEITTIKVYLGSESQLQVNADGSYLPTELEVFDSEGKLVGTAIAKKIYQVDIDHGSVTYDIPSDIVGKDRKYKLTFTTTKGGSTYFDITKIAYTNVQ